MRTNYSKLNTIRTIITILTDKINLNTNKEQVDLAKI
jgi:hypothetical protein